MTASQTIPGHIAIVMDGNGRWAKKRKRPRSMGHQAGQKALRATIEHCVRLGVETLTVFAFSSENWNRPASEISRLMEIFLKALDKEVTELHENDICLRFIGDKTAFNEAIQSRMQTAEKLTLENRRLVVNIAVNYGGRWDITQAAAKAAKAVSEGSLTVNELGESKFADFLALSQSPDPDLFIRTGGEMRISNFLLWQAAYTEFYFTDVLWPDFESLELERAISAFQSRERRYGQTSDQLRSATGA